MIELKNICKSYSNKKILKEINFKFENGKIYLIKGASGCGKTTLLNILAGIDGNYTGKYLYNGFDMNHKKSREILKNQIGYVFQSSLLISKFTIKENLLMISSDEENINYYAKVFSIDNLLNKFPHQLSGGERQRVSIIRTLIVDSNLILADEPTASLDIDAANKIAKEFLKIKNQERIVIISTHEDCFDSIADAIIDLDYGVVGKVIYNKIEYNTSYIHYNSEINYQERFKDIDKKYIKLQGSNQNNKRSTIVLVMIVTTILLMLGIRTNFKVEYQKKIIDEYPINSFHLKKQEYELLNDTFELKEYKNYFYKENDIEVFSLPSYDDSIFKNKKTLLVGKFPNNKSHILITPKIAELYYPNTKPEKIIGEKIYINNIDFNVSGIILNNDTNLSLINNSNPYYNLRENSSVIFMLEEDIKVFGNIQDGDDILVSYKNLYKNPEILKQLKENNIYLYWDNMANSFQYTINIIFNILMIMLIFSSIIMFIFMNNEILLKLHFRKKELGYLQLFNISKSRIRNILVREYWDKTIRIITYSITIFVIISVVIFTMFNVNIVTDLFLIFLLVSTILFYTFILVYIPVNKILKTDIIKLIN